MRKYYFLVFSLMQVLHPIAQPIAIPNPSVYKDTSTFYYISFCEKYHEVFNTHNSNYSRNNDSCAIDFSNYDLRGIKTNNVWKWELISPKKMRNIDYELLPQFDTLNWLVFPKDVIINDSAEFNLLKKNARYGINDHFDFNKEALIYTNVWIDCHGFFYYKIEYDEKMNTLFCHLINGYGGCRGMTPTDSWILIHKPFPNTKIELDEVKL